ncbi:hypothetical protein ACFXPV_38715 [Streptomyces sp. NPDC059118]|uniref:hypothetical protein n=1 Tax=unclassified Streptomyces TaxID=2593676 RepID=UPI0036854152
MGLISVATIQPGNVWRYYPQGVVVGDCRRSARTSMKDAQGQAGLSPRGVDGRGLPALVLTAAAMVTELQVELLFREGRDPGADRIECELLNEGSRRVR